VVKKAVEAKEDEEGEDKEDKNGSRVETCRNLSL